MKIPSDKLFDKRLVNRHIEKGLISQDQVDAQLSELEDLSDKVEHFTAEILDMGVSTVEAKDTGETE